MWVRLLRLWRELEPNRHFLKLWLAQGLSLTAFNMVNFTLLVRVFDLTHSTLMVSVFILSFGLPSLLFGAIAGTFADRWDRRRVLMATNLIRALVVLLYLPALSTLPVIYLVSFIMATVTQFFVPAEAALIPELVDRRRLVAANAAFMVTMFVAFIVGYGVAGPLSALGGDSLPVMLAAGMFAASALMCSRLPRPRHRPVASPRIGAIYQSVRRELGEGFDTLRRTEPLRYAIAQLTFIWATVGVIMVILPAFTAEVLKLSLRDVSQALIIPLGVGMLLGGFVLPYFRRRWPLRPLLMVLLLTAGVCVAWLGQIAWFVSWVTENTGLAADPATVQHLTSRVLAAVLGAVIAMVMIASQTLIHERTNPAVRGRVFGVLGVTVNVANTVPVLLAGALTDLLTVSTAVTGIGLLLIGWGIISRTFGTD